MVQKPFDDDMQVMPAPPPTNDGEPEKYSNWPSAEGYETVPEDWKPRAGRELPALRCTHVRPDETRCKNFGVRGTGFNGTPAMCFIHGGSLPTVKKKAEATLMAARMRLVQHVPTALEGLIDLSENASADAIKLKAITELLDRAGVKGGFEVNVEVNHNVSAADEISKKLSVMRDRIVASQAPAELEDQGEILDEPEKEV